MQSSGRENREQKRVKLRAPVRVWHGCGWQNVVADNLSTSGVGVYAARDLPIGEVVRAALMLSNGERIEFSAQVKHSSDEEMGHFGLQFVSLNRTASEQFARWFGLQNLRVSYL